MVDMSSEKLDEVLNEIVPATDLPLKIAAKTKNFLVLEYEENGVKIYHKIVNLNTGEVSPFPYPENTNLDGPLLQLIHMPILPNLHYLKKNLVSEKNSIIHLLKISHQKKYL